MAQLSLTFDTGTTTLASINDDIAKQYNYQPVLPDGQPNPQTKAQFSREVVRNFIVEVIKTQRRVEAFDAVTQITLT